MGSNEETYEIILEFYPPSNPSLFLRKFQIEGKWKYRVSYKIGEHELHFMSNDLDKAKEFYEKQKRSLIEPIVREEGIGEEANLDALLEKDE